MVFTTSETAPIATDSAESITEKTNPFDWVCLQYATNECEEQLPGFDDYGDRLLQYDIRGCYNQQAKEHCKLLFSRSLCWTVTILNLIKAIMMLFVAYGSSETPILTIGDAIESFLMEEDHSTRAVGLISMASMEDQGKIRAMKDQEGFPSRTKFRFKRKRKFAAAGYYRWVVSTAV